MNQEQISHSLAKLKYEGRWSVNALSEEIGLSRDTITKAFAGSMSEQTQIRLAMVLKVISPIAPLQVTHKKNKPGHFKRYLIRYYNLMRWCDVLEQDSGIKKKYIRLKKSSMTKEEAGFVCAKLDYIMKRYLMDIFGKEFKLRKGTFGDCYPAEQWVKQIRKKLPTTKQDLIKKILERKTQ